VPENLIKQKHPTNTSSYHKIIQALPRNKPQVYPHGKFSGDMKKLAQESYEVEAYFKDLEQPHLTVPYQLLVHDYR